MKLRTLVILLASVAGAGFLFLMIAGMSSPRQGTGWSHKAVSNESEASKIVGDFSTDDQALYHRGLLHVANRHEKLGTLTIGQVVDQERARAQQRADNSQLLQSLGQFSEDMGLRFSYMKQGLSNIENAANAGNIQYVYDQAKTLQENCSTLATNNVPKGFEKTAELFTNWLAACSFMGSSIAAAADDPRPSRIHDMPTSDRLIVQYAAASLMFRSEIDKTTLSQADKRRVLAHLDK
jgi:hypothetical protein